MEKIWRWFGRKDRITLDMLRQIGVEGIVTALHDVPNGNIYDYAGNSARDCWPVVNAYEDGDTLPRSYATDIRPVLFSQLRNGGYRLAAIFNEIFK